MPITYQSVLSPKRFQCRANKHSAITTVFQPHHHHIPTMAHFRIAVQPPSEIQLSQTLYPPIVAKMSARRAHRGVYFFAMAVLLREDGYVLDGYLGGNVVSTGVLVNENGSSSRSSIVFVFPDLNILCEGVFSVRLDLYRVSHEDPEGATLEDQVETSRISVFDSPVSRQRPCKSSFSSYQVPKFDRLTPLLQHLPRELSYRDFVKLASPSLRPRHRETHSRKEKEKKSQSMRLPEENGLWLADSRRIYGLVARSPSARPSWT